MTELLIEPLLHFKDGGGPPLKLILGHAFGKDVAFHAMQVIGVRRLDAFVAAD